MDLLKGRNNLESTEDIVSFVDWLLVQMIEKVPSPVDEDSLVHIGRICLFTMKLLYLPYRGNEKDLYDSVIKNGKIEYQYSTHFSVKKVVEPKSGTKKKQTTEVVQAKVSGEEKKSNVFLHNVLQNNKRNLNALFNTYGPHIVEKASAVIGHLHENSDIYVNKAIETTSVSNLPLVFHDYWQLRSFGASTNETPYGKFVEIEYIEVENDHDYDSRNTEKMDEFLKHLPSDIDHKTQSRKLDATSFLGFEPRESVDQSTKSLGLSVAKVEFDEEFDYVTKGGGPFTDFSAKALQIALVLSVPIQYILILFEHGGSDIVPSSGLGAFANIEESEMHRFTYKGLPKDKLKLPCMKYFTLGDTQIMPDAFLNLIRIYFIHKINIAAGDRTPASLIVPTAELKLMNFEKMSFGTLIFQALESLNYIYQQKVLIILKPFINWG